MDPSAPKQLGKYQVKEVLGRGAMGVVYEGFDPTIQRRVAIKTIKTELLDQSEKEQILGRFQREAQAAGNINHPDIITIYDYGEDDGTAFIAMEYVSGRELKDLLDANERLSIEQAATLMKKLLSAIAHAHKKGVVHRDLKPGNILLMDDELNRIKIMDFGIAQVESSTMTQVGTVLGTPSYMSPEQFMGQRVDARSDIYALGVIFYHLLTGEKPFTGSVTTIMHKVLQADAIPPSNINVQCPGTFDDVVAKAMSKKPEDRYGTVQEFAQAIDIAMLGPVKTDSTLSLDEDEEREITAVMGERRPSGARYRSSRSGSKLPLMAAAVVALLAIGAGVGWWYVNGQTVPTGEDKPQIVESEKPVGSPTESIPATSESTVEPTPAAGSSGETTGGIPGYAEIRTVPSGVMIRLADGKSLGVSPLSKELDAGEYDLLLTKDGYENLILNLGIESDVDTEIEISMLKK